MRNVLFIIFLIFLSGFSSKANIVYTLNYEFSPGKFMLVEVEATNIKNTGSGQINPPYVNCVPPAAYGMNFTVLYSYEVGFFDSMGTPLVSYPVINDLQAVLTCVKGTHTVYMDEVVGVNQGETSGKYLGQPECEYATVEKLSCKKIVFKVNLQGFPNQEVPIIGTSTLPVELMKFDAFKKEREIELEWKTASESNNDYFTIERSFNGITWELFKKVNGAGSTSQVTEYNATDKFPYTGISYYRLKQTDFDGFTEVFNIVSVEQDETEGLLSYPNPVFNSVAIEGVNEKLGLRIFNTIGLDVTGNVVITKSPSKKVFVDMGKLSKGVYFVVNGSESHRITKY